VKFLLTNPCRSFLFAVVSMQVYFVDDVLFYLEPYMIYQISQIMFLLDDNIVISFVLTHG